MEYKRLTYKLDEPIKTKYLDYKYMRIADYDIDRGNYGRITNDMLYNKLGEIEDKIQQGTLIAQKTCKNISEMHPVDGFTCSECGISLEDYCEKEVDEENGDITYREYVIKYCPNCGAKVVEG